MYFKKKKKKYFWGIAFFFISEVFFFVRFFWAFFHRRLSPNIEIGAIWPPFGIKVFNPFQVPLLNTVILISSGISVTWAHHTLIIGNYSQTKLGLVLTVILGFYFFHTSNIRILWSKFYFRRQSLRIYIFHCYWISWTSCNHWYFIFISDINSSYKIRI